MKIIIITQGEPFFVQAALKKLLQARAQEVKGVFLLPHYLIFGSFFLMARYYCAAYGLLFVFRLAYRRLTAIMKKILDTDKSPVPVYKIKRIDSRALTKIKQISPDLIISLSATQVFNEELLNLPKNGCVNLHSGPLPYYRGLFPTFWQFLNCEKTVGITAHFMNNDIDGGDILLQESVRILADDSLFSLLKRVKTAGIDVLLKALDMLASGNATTTPNDTARGSYYGMPGRKDVKALLSKGKRLF